MDIVDEHDTDDGFNDAFLGYLLDVRSIALEALQVASAAAHAPGTIAITGLSADQYRDLVRDAMLWRKQSAAPSPPDVEAHRWLCGKCGTAWRRNEDGSWSLYDAHQKPGQCCDNSPEFLALMLDHAAAELEWK